MAEAPKSNGRGTYPKGDESRAAILAAAKTLFSSQGFRGTSLAAVAERAGLSQPGLLHHFPSKVAVLLAVLEDRDREDGRLSSAHLTKQGVEILEALETLVEHNQTAPELVRLFSVLLGEGLDESHPAHGYMVERYDRIRSRILRNLRLGEEAGDIGAGFDLEALAAVVVAVMDGLQFQWLLDPGIDMERCYRTFRQMITGALTEEQPGRTDQSRRPPKRNRR